PSASGVYPAARRARVRGWPGQILLIATLAVALLGVSASAPNEGLSSARREQGARLFEPAVVSADGMTYGELTVRLELLIDRGGALHAECWINGPRQSHRIRACNILPAGGGDALTTTESGDPDFPTWASKSHSVSQSRHCREVSEYGHAEVLFDVHGHVTRASVSGGDVKIRC
ncbi:hypothetical protein, partial [Micromonospora sp. NPDC051141]|uniref:hypothetical protein n=1 Tax=Micromonospora sp. NPDC051141 TaxID=3364284 RepID=UPI0037B64638